MSRRRLPLEQALLGFLMQGPMHGYDLHENVENELSDVWYMGMSNVYGALKRLEQSGHVEFTLMPQDGRPSRKVYQITPIGKKSFLDWVRQPTSAVQAMRVEFLAKLYFFRVLDIDGAGDLITVQETVCRERVEQLKNAAQSPPDDFKRLVFDFRRCQIEAIIGWLLACREMSW